MKSTTERVAIVLFVICIGGFICIRYVQSIRTNQPQKLPNKPFNLPNGNTVYPLGGIVTPIDTKEDRDKASLVVWPDELLNWLFFSVELQDVDANLLTSGKFLVSEKSTFVVSKLSQSALNDDPLIVLSVIEPNANTNLDNLRNMSVEYAGKKASIRTCQGPFMADKEVTGSMIGREGKWENMSRWFVVVDIDQYEIHGEDLAIDLHIEYLDKNGLIIKDQIQGTVNARPFKKIEWPPSEIVKPNE